VTPEAEVITEIKDAEFTEGIKITKYPEDYACFKFETPDGFMIISDPYSMNETVQPDVVTESHQDSDHADTSSLESPYELITEPGEYNIGDVLIRGFAGKHNKGSMYKNNIYVFTMNDITFAHFASQGEVPSEEVLEQIGPVDILLIQAFDNPNYNKLVLHDLDIIIEKLTPKVVIPEHCGLSAGSKFAKHLKVTEVQKESGSIILTRSVLDDIEGLCVVNLENNYQ
jgi:L-ascorbate metabolism protein UlaG (beta-lactamase superfamily)